MELNPIGKTRGRLSVDRYYAYNQVGSYDPNMCSTARLSPPYQNGDDNDQNIDPEQPQVYENIILIPYQATELQDNQTDATMPQSEDVVSGYAIRQVIDAEATEKDEPTVQYQEIEQLEAQIILQRSPNGTLYQNYCVTNRVDLIENGGGDGGGEDGVEDDPTATDYPQQSGDHVGDQEEYHYSAKLTHNGDLMEQLSETNFVQLEPDLTAQNHQSEFLTGHYNQSIVLQEKDPQRMLLESTMSPLLAAVNDITQRDAELHAYLNQSTGGVLEKNAGYTNSMLPESQFHRKSLRRRCQESPPVDEDGCLSVIDKPVESRARASLPTNYLYFGNSSDKSSDISVYAKREIPLKTKFGPIEGDIRLSSDVISDILLIQASNTYPLLLVNDISILDVSNEYASNWMRFVRMARTFTEQNLLLFEEAGRLYFRSCQLILPKQELKVGYSEQYAKHYDLKIIGPTAIEIQEAYNRENPWPCFECDHRFGTSKDLQNHLTIHEVYDDQVTESKSSSSRRKRKPQKHVIDIRKNSIRCLYCNKVFMTNASLKKHIASHLPNRRTTSERGGPYRCSTCYKKFVVEEKLKVHRLTHVKHESKPFKCDQCDRSCSTPAALTAHIRSHSTRSFSCVFCPEAFFNVFEFKRHVETHATNGNFVCHICKKRYTEYHLVRKHIRIFHQTMKFSCNECGRKFPNMVFLRRHKVCHSDRYDFLCSQCGKQFKRKDKLREHVRRIHVEGRKQRSMKIKSLAEQQQQELFVNDGSQYLDLSPRKELSQPAGVVHSHHQLEDYRSFTYKCDDCMLGFKRRGMLVNHMAKRHPTISIDSIPELNLPILKPQSLFFCQYCSKVYKNNAKRKLHILKNHPGEKLPPSAHTVTKPSEINARTIGNLTTEPYRCQWCYKQYASRSRLTFHHRKQHANVEFVSKSTHPSPPHHQLEDYQSMVQQYQPSLPPALVHQSHGIDIYRPAPCSPENKLLKLSSAALELSSIEDRQFFDFLNEKSEEGEVVGNAGGTNDVITESSHLRDTGTAFSKVDVNFKVVESEFSETSSNGELNRLPQLFEESIACYS